MSSRPARSAVADLSFLARIDRGERGLARSIADLLRAAIEEGPLRPGDRLPSTRRAAAEFGFARTTVAFAFDMLLSEGYLEADRGSGTFVAVSVPSAPAGTVAAEPERFSLRALPAPAIMLASGAGIDFRACVPSVELLAHAAWRRACAWAGSRPLPNDYGDAAGETLLRESIATYLRRARSLAAEPGEVVVTGGAVEAIHLVAELALRPGDRVAMEDPGFPLARQAFELAGAEVVPCPVDENGLVVERLESLDARVVYVTPSHQFPVGGRLPLSRRLRLLEWAADRGALVVEDDYDGEFRFDAPPIPPLASLPGAGRVVYVGTFSKNLSPSLRLGYAVARGPVAAALAERKAARGYHAPMLPQLALARFMADGHLARHVARNRRLYAARRQALASAAARYRLPGRLVGLDAGLHVFLAVEQFSVPALIERARARGVALTDIACYAAGPIAHRGVVLGYSHLSLEAIEAGVAGIAAAAGDISGRTG